MVATIRRYRDGDLAPCRAPWADLTAWHRELYSDPSIGGADPGSFFDAYLAEAGREPVWVAEVGGAVVGLAGTIPRGSKAELEPIVVASDHRRLGIGRRLIEAAVADARDRGHARCSCVRPGGTGRHSLLRGRRFRPPDAPGARVRRQGVARRRERATRGTDLHV